MQVKEIHLHLTVEEFHGLKDLLAKAGTSATQSTYDKMCHIADRLPRRRTAPTCTYCETHEKESMMPYHDASHRCESGKRSHCTCDTCF